MTDPATHGTILLLGRDPDAVAAAERRQTVTADLAEATPHDQVPLTDTLGS